MTFQRIWFKKSRSLKKNLSTYQEKCSSPEEHPTSHTTDVNHLIQTKMKTNPLCIKTSPVDQLKHCFQNQSTWRLKKMWEE